MSIGSLVNYEIQKSHKVLGPASSNAANDSPLVRFIPTETVTLYVAALVNLPAMRTLGLNVTSEHIYWIGALFTAVWSIVLFVQKNDIEIKRWRIVWGIASSCIAYLVWALAVPGNPYINIASTAQSATTTQIAGAAVAAFFAIFISTILSGVESILTYINERPSAERPT